MFGLEFTAGLSSAHAFVECGQKTENYGSDVHSYILLHARSMDKRHSFYGLWMSNFEKLACFPWMESANMNFSLNNF